MEEELIDKRESKRAHNFKDLTGQRFGRITIIEFVGTIKSSEGKKKTYWRYKCDCGNIKIAYGRHFITGRIKSCGCLSKRRFCGDIPGTYITCIKKGAEERGIKFLVTKEDIWDIYKKQDGKCALSGLPIVFKKYLGKDDSGRSTYTSGTASLDRIDSEKDYTIDNIQWIHKDINFMKQAYDQEYFIKICTLIAKTNKKKSKEK